MAHETETLAGYVADLRFDDIPPEVLERAKVLTLDFLGSTIRARRDAESTPSMLKMLEALALDGKGEATVFGDDKTWTPAVAALLNGGLAAIPAKRSLEQALSGRCRRHEWRDCRDAGAQRFRRLDRIDRRQAWPPGRLQRQRPSRQGGRGPGVDLRDHEDRRQTLSE